jgi:peptidoglycan hydrolase-like protein with peptidoglycan-binding domain
MLELSTLDRAVLENAIKFVEDEDNGYGRRVDGTEDLILTSFVSLALRMLAGDNSPQLDDSGTEVSNDQEWLGALGYAYSMFVTEDDGGQGWATPEYREPEPEGCSPWVWPAGLTPEIAKEQMERYQTAYGNNDPGSNLSRWDYEWC